VTVKQQVVVIPRDQPEEAIDSYKGKLWKRGSLRRKWKTMDIGLVVYLVSSAFWRSLFTRPNTAGSV